MLPEDFVQSVHRTVSGIKAKDYAKGISQYHRIQGTDELGRALDFIQSEIGKISDAKIKRFEYPADGKGKIGLWKNLHGWTPKSATLSVIEPEERKLCDFDTQRISLAAHSTAIDCDFEVIDVGRGLLEKDYQNLDVKGKVVLTYSKQSRVHRIACLEKGAAGILSYRRSTGKDDSSQLRPYEGLWPEPEDKENTGFGFSLTRLDGLQIKRWLEEGEKVVVRAKVDAKLGEGKHQILSALMEGEDTSQELWLVAHVCHPNPGANDNASGSGAILEALRTISRLIREDALKNPEISIRFIWMPEWHGTIQLIDSEEELLEKCKFVINADMVGADPCKTGSMLNFFRTPYSLPSTLNNVLTYWLAQEAERDYDASTGGTIVPLPWKEKVYSAGSDHFLFTDSTVGIPAVMLNQFPDKFYHTSEDTTDKLDPQQMLFVCSALTLSALSIVYPRYVCKETLLTHCRNEMRDISNRVINEAMSILGQCLDDPEKIYPRTMRWLTYAQKLAMSTLDKASEEWYFISEEKDLLEALKASIEMSYATEMVVARKAYLGACAEVGVEAKGKDEFDLESYNLKVEAKRTLKYAFPPSAIYDLPPQRRDRYFQILQKDSHMFRWVDELLNLSSDWTQIEEIWDKLSFQFGKIQLKRVMDVVQDLQKLEVVQVRDG
ncbi:DUF4910 domain-containing protein [Candidatus Thorarchaeota archaeon]|nr:MAG: DUF4910 domain-containing protein [Candidatus Thorarchaeota archaeon]